GGDAETLRAVEPVLGVMGRKWFHLGPTGAGQTIKLAMNGILALQVDAMAEALAIVKKAGLGEEQLIEVMQASMARSGLLDLKAPLMAKGEYKPSFPLRLMHKDLGLLLDLANQLGVALPATAAAREVYSSVKGEAKQDLDYSAVMEVWKKSGRLLRGLPYLKPFGGKKPMGSSRAVRRPDGASRIDGMELTATDAVAMSPCEPPGIVRLIFGWPVSSTMSAGSFAPTYICNSI